MSDKATSIAWQQGESWRLRVEEVTLGNDRSHQRAFIDHPGAVVLIPLRDTEHGPELLMLRQFRHALDETILELPAGTRGWDEEWLACAQRELREETGYRAAEFTPLGALWPAPGVSNELMTLYLATGLAADPLPQDVDEEIEVTPMSLSELMEMARDGRIRDAKTIIGIFRTAHHLGLTL